MSNRPACEPARTLYEPVHVPHDLARLSTSSLTPAQHASLILPTGAKGMLVTGRWDRETVTDRRGRPETRFTYRQAGAKACEVVEAVERHRPVLVAMNAYRARGRYGEGYHDAPDKQGSNLVQLRAVWVELDSYKVAEYRHTPASSMLWQVLDRIDALGLPVPSYVVSSGRGLHLVWLTEGVPSVALRAWQALQGRINAVFGDMGADRVAAPATANLRLAGTVNKGRPVEMVWPSTVGDIRRYSFRALCEEVLPYTPEQCREHRERVVAEKATRVATARSRVSRGASPTLTGETYWDAMERDLWRLLELRYPADAPVERDRDEREHGRFLFALARVWAWRLLDATELKARIVEHAPRLGFKPAAALRECGSILRRLAVMQRGEARRDRPGTGLYRIGPKVLVAEFGISVAEAQKGNLRMLVPAALKPARVAERQAKTRLGKGMKPRSDTQAARLELGRRGLLLRAEGLSRPAIAERLGKSLTFLDTAMREARLVDAATTRPAPRTKVAAADPVTMPEPSAEAVPQASSASPEAPSRGSSRYIAIASDALPSLDTGEATTYTPNVRDRAAPGCDRQPAGSERIGGLSHVRALRRSRVPEPAYP